MIKINFAEMQQQFDNKEIVLSGGDGKAPMKNYEYALLKDGDNNSVEISFFNKDNKELYCTWGARATYKDFTASEIGFYERNGLCVEYVARGCISSRNIIAKFKVKAPDLNRIDLSTEALSSYFQEQLDTLADEEKDNTKFVNDFIAKLYYEIIL